MAKIQLELGLGDAIIFKIAFSGLNFLLFALRNVTTGKGFSCGRHAVQKGAWCGFNCCVRWCVGSTGSPGHDSGGAAGGVPDDVADVWSHKRARDVGAVALVGVRVLTCQQQDVCTCTRAAHTRTHTKT